MKIGKAKVSTDHSIYITEKEKPFIMKDTEYRAEREAERLSELMNPENNGRILP